jgi:L-fuconolactonase
MILDHCGKPGIKEGAIAQYREDVKDLARYPNMWIKLSDLPPYAGPNWTGADLRPRPLALSARSMPATTRSSSRRRT